MIPIESSLCYRFLIRHHNFPIIVIGLMFVGLLCFSSGCSVPSNRYVESYELKRLTVVFLDEDSLREEWAQLAGRDAVRFSSGMNSNIPVVKTVRGFYSFATNTLYCPKWNFEVCGHELHHAAIGQFHAQD